MSHTFIYTIDSNVSLPWLLEAGGQIGIYIFRYLLADLKRPMTGLLGDGCYVKNKRWS